MKDKYTPGQDCGCYAYSESECGCDADWTPTEVYELREQLKSERALADRLAEALLQLHRDAYGGQLADPQCDCCDCDYLRPINDTIDAWKEARSE
jgi:hypothetical protein